MFVQFDAGRYRVRIQDQCFVESRQKGTPGFLLSFRVLENLDNPEAPVKSYLRNTTLWITERTKPRVLHQLHELGYKGSTLSGVDPDNPGFHSFADVEAEMVCTHETTDRGTFERWELGSNGGGNKPQKLRDKSILRQLDGEVDQSLVVATEAGVTDDDIPF
jgi:hypothetical protein